MNGSTISPRKAEQPLGQVVEEIREAIYPTTHKLLSKVPGSTHRSATRTPAPCTPRMAVIITTNDSSVVAMVNVVRTCAVGPCLIIL